jgi:hypothetical protein
MNIDALVKKMHFILFAAGLLLLGICCVSGYANFRADTLLVPIHCGVVLGTGLAGIFCIYTALHSRSAAVIAGQSTEPSAGLSLLIKLLESRLMAVVPEPVKAVVEPIEIDIAAVAKTAAITELKAGVGKFLAPLGAQQDIEALYHLAEQAAAAKLPGAKAEMLALLQKFNDKLFMLHHNMPEVRNDQTQAATPAVPPVSPPA